MGPQGLGVTEPQDPGQEGLLHLRHTEVNTFVSEEGGLGDMIPCSRALASQPVPERRSEDSATIDSQFEGAGHSLLGKVSFMPQLLFQCKPYLPL